MRMSNNSEPRPNPLVRTLAKLQSQKHNLKRRFEIIRTLGEGTYGKVKLAVNKYNGEQRIVVKLHGTDQNLNGFNHTPLSTFSATLLASREDRKVAIKYIRKQRIRTKQDLIRIQREIKIMSSIKHPHIVNVMEVYENQEKIILVMEYASGGELYDFINRRKVLSEQEARKFFRQIVSAIHHCHKMGIVHRDLKLENIVMDGEGNVKIADFGLSNEFNFEQLLSTYCGSPLYASPEIVNGQPYYGPEIDCWSLGVLLYTLVYGAMPFDSSDNHRLKRQITEGDYFEPARPSDASSLIRLLLEIDPDKRATISTISQHWWVNVGYTYPATEEGLDRNHLNVPLTSLRQDATLTAYNQAVDSDADESRTTKALRTLQSKDSGCGSFDSVCSRRRIYNLQEMRSVLDSVDSGRGSLQHSSFSTTASLDMEGDASSSPEVSDNSAVRKRIRRHDALTNRYSYGSMSSNSSCDVLDFSYDSLDGMPAGRFTGDLEDLTLHQILKPKSKSVPNSPDESEKRGRLCKTQYFDLEEAEFIYQKATEIIKT